MVSKIYFTIFIAILLCLSVTGASVDVDNVSTEEVDTEAALKCDTCILIAHRFSESFSGSEERIRVRLSAQQATEAAERVCDGQWHGYGTVMVEDVMRLAGPDTGREVGVADEGESLWSHRLQDMCDELLAEATSEKMLYEAWASAGAEGLEHTLCRGSGFFSACSAAGNFGPWPGDDDYDDYDDNDDFEYVHDEF